MVMRGSTLLSLLEIELFGSKYNNRHCSLRRPSFPRLRRCTQLKLKVPGSVQIFIWEGGGGILQTNSNSKCKDLSKFSFSEGGEGERWVLQTNSNWKCQDLSKFSFSGGRGWGGGTLEQLKLKVPRSVQIFMGRGVLQTNIPEILEWEHSSIF